jgi:hypothetical protein
MPAGSAWLRLPSRGAQEMRERLQNSFRRWLGVEELNLEVAKLNLEISKLDLDIAQHQRVVNELIEQQTHIITELKSRVQELEESYARNYSKKDDPPEPEPIVRGHLPFSVRRRQAERRKKENT